MRIRSRLALATFLVFLPTLATAQAVLPLKHAPRPTSSAISRADLITRVYIFADDSMMGRAAGTTDNLRGTAYIEREVRRLGLRPAGEAGSYFQNVPLVRRGLDGPATLTVDGRSFGVGADFLPRDNGPSVRAVSGAPVIYGGAWGGELIDSSQTAGKVVLIGVPQGWQSNRGLLTQRFMNAAAVAVVSYDAMPEPVRAALREGGLSMAGAGGDAPAVPQFFYVGRALASAMLGSSLDSAVNGAAGRSVIGTVRFADRPAPARNVIAVIPGSDPRLRGQYVAIGAHNDHIGFSNEPIDHDSVRAVLTVARPEGADSPNIPITEEQWARIRTMIDSLRAITPRRPDSIYNGADDDGSGSMALLEIAEAIQAMRVKPKRSIIFVWHTGEEQGLYGAEWFTEHPTVPRDSIVTQVNLDMVGRASLTDRPSRGAGYLQLIGSRRLSTELGDLVEAVNASRRAPFTFDYTFDANGHPGQYYCRSDHYEYARFGIPVVFFSTGGHRDYHQLTDEPQYLDYDHFREVTQLIHDVTVRVANLDHRPVVDKPKPDPQGGCRQ